MAGDGLAQLASKLTALGRRFYARGWVLGTSGNFSAVMAREPLRLAITASSVHKGRMTIDDIVTCDETGGLVADAASRDRAGLARKPSAETLLHVEIARRQKAGAVLHTHSVWTTILSDVHAGAGGFSIDGYEMLKGLAGVGSHEHREWIPIVDNDQDMSRLAQTVGTLLGEYPDLHAFLLRRHGLYTWGDTLLDAERHTEILEFLFETVGRTAQFTIDNSQLTKG